ncbi:lysophospholipid acyltransferase family protein [Inquilinus sp. CAU 1745]|uniref:lysophospholipid acyltransferase family protein n=1 Tax=Inquilinus sp. CAU 1745 TaxID=3140369 RepID=UPI00325C1FFE
MPSRIAAAAITGFARLVTGVRPDWAGCPPDPVQRIYFANHASHGDFVLVWTVLPSRSRALTRPVAGADYWGKGRLRRFIGAQVFRAVLIDRDPASRTSDPVSVMASALDEGDSLILFPEGTRNMTDEPLLPFKSGLYHLAASRPEVDLVPVWIDNISRVMPKGELLPIPLLCGVAFGAPLRLAEGEEKSAFLARTRAALLALAPGAGR